MRLNSKKKTPDSQTIAEEDPLPPDDLPPRANADWLERCYRLHRERLLRFARRHAPHDRAPDIVQQLFTRLAARGGTEPPAIGDPGAYLRRAILNLIRDDLRIGRRRSHDLHCSTDDVEPQAGDQTAALEARDALRRLEKAVSRLDPRTREIFLAHRIDGLSYGEIAVRTGLSVKTVEKHMSRAIAFVARQIRV